jgi:hypothetical protein
MSQRKYERVFEGKDNAGLRKAIRDQVSGAWCGPENERMVMYMTNRIAFTPPGLVKLQAVAADYRAANGEEYKRTCDCSSCVQVGLENLRLAGAGR